MTDTAPREHKILDDEGKEFVQKPINLDDAPPPRRRRRSSAARVLVYNKRRSRVHCTDCILEPESEGSILVSDLGIKGVADNVIKVAR